MVSAKKFVHLETTLSYEAEYVIHPIPSNFGVYCVCRYIKQITHVCGRTVYGRQPSEDEGKVLGHTNKLWSWEAPITLILADYTPANRSRRMAAGRVIASF